MNINVFFQKRFLVYALLLHSGVVASFVLFDGENTNENKVETKKRIVEIDVASPTTENDSIMAETFSEEDLQEELNEIQSMSSSFKNDSKLNDARLKEKEKELKALEAHSKKTKDNLLKEKKKLQLEKKKIEDDKARALREKQNIEKEKRKMEAEIKRLKEEATKKDIAKQKEKQERANRLAEEKRKKAEQAKISKKKKTLSTEEWLKTNSGQNEYFRYGNSIMSKIKGRWIKPSSARSGWVCKLQIEQGIKGEIKRIQKINCNPDNEKFYQSVHRAVMQSSPLPLPKDNRLFDNKMDITFKVD